MTPTWDHPRSPNQTIEPEDKNQTIRTNQTIINGDANSVSEGMVFSQKTENGNEETEPGKAKGVPKEEPTQGPSC